MKDTDLTSLYFPYGQQMTVADYRKFMDERDAQATAKIWEIMSLGPKKVDSPDFHGVIGGPEHVISRLLTDSEE